LALIALAHDADQETGLAQVTYDALCLALGISRPMLSAGLKLLAARGIVLRSPEIGQSGYQLADYDLFGGWAKLPSRQLYQGEVMPVFNGFTLRNANQLNALKLYLLFAARRDRNTNQAHITYDDIERLSGVDRPRIRAALSVLTSQGLVHVDRFTSQFHERGVANAYRLAHIDPYRHPGTSGRPDPYLRPTSAAEPPY
jgi:DNA-binding transcriptional ArsR family regulator